MWQEKLLNKGTASWSPLLPCNLVPFCTVSNRTEKVLSRIGSKYQTFLSTAGTLAITNVFSNWLFPAGDMKQYAEFLFRLEVQKSTSIISKYPTSLHKEKGLSKQSNSLKRQLSNTF